MRRERERDTGAPLAAGRAQLLDRATVREQHVMERGALAANVALDPGRAQTVQVADKMYICNGAGKWFELNWSPDRQPACLSDETGGVHWRDTSSFPSKAWDCVGGKWVPGADRMHPVRRTATDVVEGATTKVVSTAGISNVDWNNGTWVVISGVTGACAAINQPWQIKATGGNSITVDFDSSTCGAITPSQLQMQFQFSNWDTKNGGEFKNTLGAHVR